MDKSTLKTLLSNEIICNILQAIAERKRVSFKELRDLVIGLDNVKAYDAFEKALQVLHKANLIGVVNSEFRDFDSYYLTSAGVHLTKKMESFAALEIAAVA